MGWWGVKTWFFGLLFFKIVKCIYMVWTRKHSSISRERERERESKISL
ncbi:MAG: hypothetical protein MRERV_13c023 [Mycoplasmataceae bacterium RV_VA103A]|nr:MAG: hypothetical protein MRERV_13c023 [Mycoplasmataceae bacterium RV_VA103A]